MRKPKRKSEKKPSRQEKGYSPVKSLKAVGLLLLCVTQNTSCFLFMYNPGSTIIGLAR